MHELGNNIALRMERVILVIVNDNLGNNRTTAQNYGEQDRIKE